MPQIVNMIEGHRDDEGACMTSLRFFGGVGEIGGNKVLLEDEGVRVWFDFGQSFTMGCDYYTGWLRPRNQNGLGDYFEFDLLPRLKGLYTERLLANTGLRYETPRFDAVFLSHAHFDHVGHIGFLDPSIPIWCGSGTKLFLEAAEETSGFTNYGKHEYRTFRTYEEKKNFRKKTKIKIRHLEVEPWHVDHSIPSAYGFIIHTSAGVVVYTGDIRAHGPRKEMTEEFLKAAREAEPVALITEGTKFTDDEEEQNENDSEKNSSEEDVKEQSTQIVSEMNKLVFVTHYSRDMDRLRTFYQVAKENDRKLVISPKTAYLLEKLLDDTKLDLPDPLKDNNILVYYKRKKTGTFQESDYYIWERRYWDKQVDYKYVHENQGSLLVNLDFYQFTELIDIKPAAHSLFIHSMSEPFSEEDLEDEVMRNWIKHFKLDFLQLHASGHMSKNELKKAIEYICPRKVFPVHTENPRLFKRFFDHVVPPEKGKRYLL